MPELPSNYRPPRKAPWATFVPDRVDQPFKTHLGHGPALRACLILRGDGGCRGGLIYRWTGKWTLDERIEPGSR